MSVLIHMDMPKNCGECVYRHLTLMGGAFCTIARKDIPLFRTGEKGRLDNCPLAEVVQCKDCKHWYNAPVADKFNSCEKDALIRHETFFCASGERRTEE